MIFRKTPKQVKIEDFYNLGFYKRAYMLGFSVSTPPVKDSNGNFIYDFDKRECVNQFIQIRKNNRLNKKDLVSLIRVELTKKACQCMKINKQEAMKDYTTSVIKEFKSGFFGC